MSDTAYPCKHGAGVFCGSCETSTRSEKLRCQKCGQVPNPGELYVEVHRAEDRDGTTVITRGPTSLLAHLNCPERKI